MKIANSGQQVHFLEPAKIPHAARRMTTIDTSSAVFRDKVMADGMARSVGTVDNLAGKIKR